MCEKLLNRIKQIDRILSISAILNAPRQMEINLNCDLDHQEGNPLLTGTVDGRINTKFVKLLEQNHGN